MLTRGLQNSTTVRPTIINNTKKYGSTTTWHETGSSFCKLVTVLSSFYHAAASQLHFNNNFYENYALIKILSRDIFCLCSSREYGVQNIGMNIHIISSYSFQLQSQFLLTCPYAKVCLQVHQGIVWQSPKMQISKHPPHCTWETKCIV